MSFCPRFCRHNLQVELILQFAEWVYEGTIGTELLRPVTLFYTLFARRSGEFAYFILWKGIPGFSNFFFLY